jgi:hypothetical protein
MGTPFLTPVGLLCLTLRDGNTSWLFGSGELKILLNIKCLIHNTVNYLPVKTFCKQLDVCYHIRTWYNCKEIKYISLALFTKTEFK